MAELIKLYVIYQGIPETRILPSTGCGLSNPIYPLDLMNNRVELYLVKINDDVKSCSSKVQTCL